MTVGIGILLAVFLFAFFLLSILFILNDEEIHIPSIVAAFISSLLLLFVLRNIAIYNNSPWEVRGSKVVEIQSVTNNNITQQTLLFTFEDRPYLIDLNQHFKGFVNATKVNVTFYKTYYGLFKIDEIEYSLELLNE